MTLLGVALVVLVLLVLFDVIDRRMFATLVAAAICVWLLAVFVVPELQR